MKRNQPVPTMDAAIKKAIRSLPVEQRSEWREIHEDTTLELDWRTLPRWTPEHRDSVAAAIRNWALLQSDARDVLRAIACSDRRVGVWLACAYARTALRHVPNGDVRPRLAIEAAERWVRGEATENECRAAAASSSAVYAEDTTAAAAVAAAAAAEAAADAAYAAYAAYADAADAAAAASAAYAANAVAYSVAHAAGSGSWITECKRTLRDLCQTIENATRDALDAAAEGYHTQVQLL